MAADPNPLDPRPGPLTAEEAERIYEEALEVHRRTPTRAAEWPSAGLLAVAAEAARREREAERARAVAWLRERARMVMHGEIRADGYGTAVTYVKAADAIERGEHEKGGE